MSLKAAEMKHELDTKHGRNLLNTRLEKARDGLGLLCRSLSGRCS